ncbi:class I SAM-dependent methyltransferase [Dongshaea marina]|uniref:class I SAM-dependent methyltransferase n=1 Tax=Dongshaea marina TaxID=2047966 RepID=UPI000D3EC42D|nr:class I SAM-dependent methyltransferase [Dongshaea marina]
MHFDHQNTRGCYNAREVDASWLQWCQKLLEPVDKTVIDLGCGGGIYARGFIQAGASHVYALDSSEQYIQEAAGDNPFPGQLDFIHADACAVPLGDAVADILFERAMVHHLNETQKLSNLREARRLLKPDGLLVIQDRTFDDILDISPQSWIRSTLFECFPRLLEFEEKRCPSTASYLRLMKQAGFTDIQQLQYREVRKRYPDFEALATEIKSRKGKSILYELSENELKLYCQKLKIKSLSHPLVETDRWSVWLANNTR